MSRLSLAGLNLRLLLLVLLAMLPAFALLLYNAAAERQRAAALVRDDTVRLAGLTAARVGQIIEGQRQLAIALASHAAVIAQDAADCQATFSQLVAHYPLYSSLNASTPAGDVFCSTLPLTSPVSVAQRGWFQRAVSNGGFALGEYQPGRVAGTHVLIGAYPAYAAGGELRAVVSLGLSLTWLDHALAEIQLPPGSAVNIVDQAGTLLSRYPNPAEWVGQPVPDGPLLEMLLAEAPGTAELAGLDGTTRLYAFELVETQGAGEVHVAVGIPTALAYAGAEQALIRNLVLMGLAGVVALAITRAAAVALVLRPASTLQRLAERLAGGDLRARAGGPYSGGELGSLARTFDQMAVALEAREIELQQAVRSLETLSACNQALVRADSQPQFLEAICHSLVEVGGYRLAWIGLTPAAEGASPRPLQVAAHAAADPGPAGDFVAGFDLAPSADPRRSPVAAALNSRAPVITILRHADAKGLPWQTQALALGFQAAVALPIVLEGQPLGVLSLLSAEANAFDPRTLQFLQELAGDVAFGLHTLRLRAARQQAEAQLQRHAHQASTLAEISRDLVAVTTDEPRVLEVIARRVALRLGDVCVIRLLSEDGQWLLPAALYHPDAARLDDLRQALSAHPLPAGEGIAAQVLASGQVLRLATVTPEQVRAQTQPALWPAIERLQIHSALFAPLRTQAQTLGVINVVRLAGSPAYTADDQAFAQELADRAALSIGNARLYQSLQRLNDELEARVADRTAALQQAAAEFEDLYDAAPCGYHSLNADGIYVRINQYELDLLGYTRAEIIGRLRFSDVLAPHSRPVFQENFPRFKATGRITNLEFDLVHRDGRVIPVLLSATAIYDADGRYLMSRSTLFDITDRKQAEAQITRLHEELAQHARQLETANQELQAFSYSVSHDLRAPLRSLDGFSLALLEDYAGRLDDTGRDYLQRIRAAAQRMGELIDALLILSRVTRTELRHVPVNLSRLAEGIVADLRQRDPERAVDVSIAPGLTTAGDPSLLRVVLENLLGNAWKFTAGRAPAHIELGCLEDASGGSVFYVRDDGAGFDMTYADRLFGAFQRLHDQREFKGTGIGLATVQRIVHRHGGRVWAEGATGAGATFYFTVS